ncbi:MAG TPA: hypothetical protein VFN26_06495 [Candidatus Acidoferrum sp.]|nr:hypothetical protein [Candidatus Acidoferrum sp.]
MKDDPSITLLVNNAGCASVAPLLHADIQKMEDMIALDVTAPTRLRVRNARPEPRVPAFFVRPLAEYLLPRNFPQARLSIPIRRTDSFQVARHPGNDPLTRQVCLSPPRTAWYLPAAPNI